ncbi:hypothetical protein [Weissella cibaria]|uniref:hypothetical protein n=1 Tax=Weissella cibaria TaxID=137591 RepID=UPI00215AB9FA|nr:hypothetical protein [Weissella cibaria]MCR8703048.1 hypothetical protein [Weissella cibaria]
MKGKAKVLVALLAALAGVTVGSLNNDAQASTIKQPYQGNWYGKSHGKWYQLHITNSHVTGNAYMNEGNHVLRYTNGIRPLWNSQAHGYYMIAGYSGYGLMQLGFTGDFTTIHMTVPYSGGQTTYYRSKNAALHKYFNARVQRIDATTKKPIAKDWYVKSPAEENWWFNPGNGYKYYQLQGAKKINYQLHGNRTFKIYYKATYRKLTINNIDYDTGRVISKQTKMVKVGSVPTVVPAKIANYQAYTKTFKAKKVNLDQNVNVYYRRLYTVTANYVTNEGTAFNPKMVAVTAPKKFTYVVGSKVTIKPTGIQYYNAPAPQSWTVTNNRTITFAYTLNKKYFLDRYNQEIANKHFDADHLNQFKIASKYYYDQMNNALSLKVLKGNWDKFEKLITTVQPLDADVYDANVQISSWPTGRPQDSDSVPMYKSVTKDGLVYQSDLWRTPLHAWFMYSDAGNGRQFWVTGPKSGSAWISNDYLQEGKTEALKVPASLTYQGQTSTPVSQSTAAATIAYESKTDVDLTGAQKNLVSKNGIRAYITGYTIYHNVFDQGINVVYMKYKYDGTDMNLGSSYRNDLLISPDTYLNIDGKRMIDAMMDSNWNASSDSDWASWFVVPGQYTDEDIADSSFNWSDQYGANVDMNQHHLWLR